MKPLKCPRCGCKVYPKATYFKRWMELRKWIRELYKEEIIGYQRPVWQVKLTYKMNEIIRRIR